jgi:hypothetical protein
VASCCEYGDKLSGSVSYMGEVCSTIRDMRNAQKCYSEC